MFRPVADGDVPAIVRLMNRAYRGADNAFGWTTEETYLAGNRTTEEFLRADIEGRPSASLLKWQDAEMETITGCVWLEPITDDTWYLGSLAVDPGRQNGGLGRTMLAAAEGWARDRGARRIRMTVINVRDALIAWYLRRGYSTTGATEPFPYGDDRFGKPLRDDLCFVVLEKPI
jgi:ribosomal protein S18 acetylase RimI-like enzyme